LHQVGISRQFSVRLFPWGRGGGPTLIIESYHQPPIHCCKGKVL